MLPFVTVLVLVIAPRALSQEPRFNLVTKNVTVVAGQTAVLPCTVEYLGKYVVVWVNPRQKTLTLEDRRIITDDRISLERPYVREWNLHIRKVKTSDSGTYLCQINTDPIQFRPVMLQVQEPSKIIDHLSTMLSVSAKEGDTIELVCNVTGFPTPNVTWHRIHAGLREDDHVGKEQIGHEGEVLVIHNVSRYCDDKYQCVAYNGVPPADSREIRVHVEFPPEVRLPNKKIGQSPGRSTILECEITAYPHIMNVWRRDGQDITRSSKYTTELYNEGANKITLSLKVQSLTSDDYGEYECVSENLLGQDSETMILYEYQRPHKPVAATTTTTQKPWSTKEYPYIDQPRYEGHDSDDTNVNQWNQNRVHESESGQWPQTGNGAERTYSNPSDKTGGNNYPPYDKWRNPEYSYEPEADPGSVIADPVGDRNSGSLHWACPCIVLCIPLLIYISTR